MQETKTKEIDLAKFERVRDLFDRLQDNAELPLEMETDNDYSCCADFQARNALYFLKELGIAIDDLAEAIGVTPEPQSTPESAPKSTALMVINPTTMPS